MGRLQKKKTESQKQKTKEKADSLVTRDSKETTDSNGSGKDIQKKPDYVSKYTSSEKSGKLSADQSDSFINRSLTYLREVKIELKKVVWPPKKQTYASTVIVIILVFILASFLGLVDTGLSNLVKLVL